MTNDTRYTLKHLQDLLACDQFHHATYRNHGSIWEGLYIYARDPGPLGFNLVGCFGKNDPDVDAAYALVRHTGVSFGARGQG